MMNRQALLTAATAAIAALLINIPSSPAMAKAPAPFKVAGYVYQDLDEDNLFTDADQPMHDVTVRLYEDQAPVGIWDRSDAWLSNEQSDDSGRYAFEQLVSGHYLLVQMPPPGFICPAGNVISLTLDASFAGGEAEFSFGNMYAELYPTRPHNLFFPAVSQ